MPRTPRPSSSSKAIETYRHTQTAGLTLVPLGATALVLALLAVVRGADTEYLAAAFVVAILALVFSSLTVEIGDDALELSFGPGIVRKTVPLAELAECAPVRTAWWHGWGIHWTPSGWLYNVAGRDAVELRLKSGTRLRIGTDEPERLCAEIRRATGRGA